MQEKKVRFPCNFAVLAKHNLFVDLRTTGAERYNSEDHIKRHTTAEGSHIFLAWHV